MAAEGVEEVLSLQDVLEEDRQLEQTANAVLGDSDDSHCTYPKVPHHSLLCILASLLMHVCATSLGLCEASGSVCVRQVCWGWGAGWIVSGLQSTLPRGTSAV